MRMKKFINDPKKLVGELLKGFTLAFPAQVKLSGTNTIVRANPKARGKVRVVTLGADSGIKADPPGAQHDWRVHHHPGAGRVPDDDCAP